MSEVSKTLSNLRPPTSDLVVRTVHGHVFTISCSSWQKRMIESLTDHPSYNFTLLKCGRYGLFFCSISATIFRISASDSTAAVSGSFTIDW